MSFAPRAYATPAPLQKCRNGHVPVGCPISRWETPPSAADPAIWGSLRNRGDAGDGCKEDCKGDRGRVDNIP
jgi:hypothetical protein